MVANYYTLLHVARDLDARVSGKRLLEVFSQNSNELIVHCEGDSFVVVNCEPSSNSIFLRSSYSRTKKNSVEFFELLNGQEITAIDMNPSDREILFRFPSHRIVVQMFGSKANVLLVDSGNAILESFLKPKEFDGKNYAPRPKQDIHNVEERLARLKDTPDATVLSALKKSFPQLGSELARETLARSSVDPNRKVSDVTPAEFAALSASYKSLLQEVLTKPSPLIYFDGEQARAFALVPLQEFQNLSVKTFESIHDALRTFVSRSHRDKAFIGRKEILLQRLSLEIERATRTLGKIGVESVSHERADGYERCGKLILANLAHLKKGMKTATVTDDADVPASLSLNPSLSPTQNAEAYFDKAKKSRASITETRDQKSKLERKLGLANSLLEQIKKMESPEELGQFAEQHAESLEALGIKLDKRGKNVEDRVPFRVFTVAGGFQVWAGKSSENNDLLTMKHAKPNDLWFHARGSGGSHVVLKLGTGKGEPSKQSMEQAAAIAAYYSKMKASKTVPVAMTQRKYVRKPRGAPAGTVTIEKEKVLFVEPRLPQQAESI